MADVGLVTSTNTPMILQKPFGVRHAQVPVLGFDSNESLIPHSSQGLYFPDVLVLPCCNDILDSIDVFFCEGMEDSKVVSPMFWGRLEHPSIIIDVVIDIEWATRDLIEVMALF